MWRLTRARTGALTGQHCSFFCHLTHFLWLTTVCPLTLSIVIPPSSLRSLSRTLRKEQRDVYLWEGTVIPFKWRDDGGEGRVTQFYQNGGLDCFGCLSHRTVIRLSLFMPTNTSKRHGSFGSGANFSRWNCLNKCCNLQMTCQVHFSPSLLSGTHLIHASVFLCSYSSTNFLDWGCDCTSWEEVSLVLQRAFPKAQSRSVQHKQANPDKSNKRKPHGARRTIWPVNALQLSLLFAGCWLTQLLHIPNNVKANPVQRWWWMMLLRWVQQQINEAWIHIMGTVRGFPDCIKCGKINLPELSLGEEETARLLGCIQRQRQTHTAQAGSFRRKC